MSNIYKVCQVTRRFVEDHWGGTESAVLRLSQELEECGIESPIFSTSMLSKAGPESLSRVGIRRFPYIFPWFFLSTEEKKQMVLRGGSPLSFSMFWALLFERNLSLIHTHIANRLGGIVRTVARLRRIPYIVSLHAGYYTLPTEQSLEMMKPFSRKWEWGKVFGFALGSRRVFRDANAIICVGRDEYECMCQAFPGKAIYYLPNGVDTENFRSANPQPFRRHYGFGEKEKILLCLSRIDSQKNQRLLIQAFAQLRKDRELLHLVLAGPITDEVYAKELVNLATKLGIKDRVHFVGGLKHNDPLLASAYKAAEIFVLPSTHEPFGIVILEAWASAVPVVASNVGGIPGFTKDGQDIALFPSKSEKHLVATLERVLESKELRESMVKHGLESVKNYDWSAITAQMVTIYQKALDS